MNTTIDQWEVLEAVVQLGSFAAAASKMNRSQSTISYAVSRLQDQFKTPLLEMKGRKAQLTEAGKALLADVEPLLSGFDRPPGAQVLQRISGDTPWDSYSPFRVAAVLNTVARFKCA